MNPRLLAIATIVAGAVSAVACVPRVRTAPDDRIAANVFATRCVSCHTLDGEGGVEGPDLTHEGRKRDADWLVRWIANPSDVDPVADMPSFRGTLTGAELTAIANYLAARK